MSTATDLQGLEDLAHSKQQQGDFGGSEALLRNVLSERLKSADSPDHDPNVIRAKNNLAASLNSQYKDLAYAEALQLEVVAADRQGLGPEHPDTLVDLNNLANIYMHQGRYDEAVKLHRETLSISERVNGETHENTLTVKHNLANALKHQEEASRKEDH
jgi:tetratricopeptide (TPR) repeat protein